VYQGLCKHPQLSPPAISQGKHSTIKKKKIKRFRKNRSTEKVGEGRKVRKLRSIHPFVSGRSWAASWACGRVWSQSWQRCPLRSLLEKERSRISSSPSSPHTECPQTLAAGATSGRGARRGAKRRRETLPRRCWRDSVKDQFRSRARTWGAPVCGGASSTASARPPRRPRCRAWQLRRRFHRCTTAPEVAVVVEVAAWGSRWGVRIGCGRSWIQGGGGGSRGRSQVRRRDRRGGRRGGGSGGGALRWCGSCRWLPISRRGGRSCAEAGTSPEAAPVRWTFGNAESSGSWRRIVCLETVVLLGMRVREWGKGRREEAKDDIEIEWKKVMSRENRDLVLPSLLTISLSCGA